VTDHLENFHRRVLQDALTAATASYWHRRAAVFEWAKPRPDDFRGLATEAMLRDQWQRLDDMATACRNRARAVPFEDAAEVETIMQEAA
jgi:hypothetical protein